MLAENPSAKKFRNSNFLLSIPYERLDTGMLDIQDELFVAEEFWDGLHREGNTYINLLECSEQIGTEMKS